MKAVEYTLPPNVYRKKEQQQNARTAEDFTSPPLAYLEIEVSRINFITDKSIKAQTSGAASLYKNPTHKANKSKGKQLKATSSSAVCKRLRSAGSGGVTAQIIWWGEQRETAGSISISCGCSSPSSSPNNNNNSNSSRPYEGKHKNHKQRSSQRQRCCRRRQQEHLHHHHHTNKLRYSVRSSLALFLDYLCECPPIEIVASGVCSSSNRNVNDHANAVSLDPRPLVPFGQTRLPLPAPLLRKYAANYVNGCNFEYKTKIYALYRHVESGAARGQVQQQQQLKVGEIQLHFKMLFAASAAAANASVPNAAKKAAANAAASTEPPTIKMPAALLQDQLTMAANGGFCVAPASKQQQPEHRLAGKLCNNNNNSVNIKTNSKRVAGKSAELMEAMKKLDAELAALFAAAEPLESLKQPQLDDNDLWPIADSKQEGGGHVTAALFDRVNALQLHMEALTLQPEGTQRMELLQSEMRPIFTVECQLSHELIKQVPRYDMFQIMQFESEKFQSLTQCTRFGQLAQRQVRLPKGKEQQMGHIDFTVWWREPGTCLNEMLGMGCLQLADLYRASLLEQCKCIGIQRRGVHLASVYLKISLRTDAKAAVEQRLLKSVPNGNGNVADEQLADKQDNNNSADAEGDAASNGFPAAGEYI